MVHPSYIGFDFSTQQVKLVAVDEDLQVLYENFVKFDTDLAHYKTEGGALCNGLEVTAPTLMWVESLDLLLGKAKADGVDFSSVKSISGDGQQHGSVYWRRGALQTLKNLKSSEPLVSQLKNSFSVANGPIWMDGSTTAQCKTFIEAAGGLEAIAALTGSQPFERYTGPQILKIKTTQPDAYNDTERISIVSSFAASLLCGGYAHIDISDGAGMTLMNIKTKELISSLCQLIGDDLPDKLDTIQASNTVAGNISSYFVERYGFSETCKIVNFTGDNPGSLAGMRLHEGDICLSLGTSDVVMLWLNDCSEALDPTTMVNGNPLDPDAYMGILCFKNASLVRDRFLNTYAGGSWETFGKLLNSVPKGNNGNIGIYFDQPEIIPQNRLGVHRFDAADRPQTDAEFSPAEEVRALVEGQVMSRCLHARAAGFRRRSGAKLLVTGGASVNKDLMQVVADVFHTDVYNAELANSAALGSAYRAKHALVGGPFQALVDHLGGFNLMASPDPEAVTMYDQLLDRYKRLEGTLKPAVK